jgi:hypothetical protein
VADHVCIHEHDIVAAVLGRRWDGASDELKEHAAECECCGEVVVVASLLASEQERLRYEARVPAAGQVWWRAAVRARLEAAHAAARPMTWWHGVAGACALGLAFAAMSVAWPSLRGAGAWLFMQVLGTDSRLSDMATLVTAMLQKSLPLAFVMAACIVLAPVALYFALSSDRGR